MTGQHKGNTLSEYGIILGVIAFAAIGALKLLGGNLNLSFQNQNTALTSPAMRDYVSMQFHANSGTASVNGTGSSQGGGPNTSLLLHDNVSGGINASSTDGTTVLATAHAATTIEQLSAKISDPETQSLTQQLATFLYGVTLSEGVMSDVPGLSQTVVQGKDSGYTKVNALRDIYNGIQYSQNWVNKLASGPLANDPNVIEVIRLANIAIQKANADYPLEEIRENGLNTGNNAEMAFLNQRYFNGSAGYNTQQSTINDLTLTGGNPLPDLAKASVRSALESNMLETHQTVKSGGVAAVTSDDVQVAK